MRYYVTADVHGYYSQLITALTNAGYFEDSEPHKLIICGDFFDRGEEAKKLQDFLLELLARDEVILIRGNHEDLALALLNDWHHKSYLQSQHHLNGTMDTLCQLTDMTTGQVYQNTDYAALMYMKSPYIQKIIPATTDYFETAHYIFVHGWIPCKVKSTGNDQRAYSPVQDWRNAGSAAWSKARWVNGMEAAHNGITVPGKTLVCGHWHCSFGHARYEHHGGEFHNADFSPYYGDGIIALDACTPASGKVNCIVIEDE